MRSGVLRPLRYECSVLPLNYPHVEWEWDSNPRDSVALPLSYPAARREKESNLRTQSVTGIALCRNSIQRVTTAALYCFFETATWFATLQVNTRLAVKQAL